MDILVTTGTAESVDAGLVSVETRIGMELWTVFLSLLWTSDGTVVKLDLTVVDGCPVMGFVTIGLIVETAGMT